MGCTAFIGVLALINVGFLDPEIFGGVFFFAFCADCFAGGFCGCGSALFAALSAAAGGGGGLEALLIG
jgi:hypothetical protein